MSRHAQENLVSVVLLAVFAGVIVLCQDFGPRARMIPLPLAVFGIVLTLVQVAWHNFGSPESLQMDMITVDAPAGEAPAAAQDTQGKKPSGPAWLREARAYGMVGVFLVLIFITGVMPSSFLFTAGYFMRTRYCSWPRSLAYAALVTLSLYLLFVVALEMQMYHGLLAPLFD
ncbi:MAG: tripartite tricarboxylate transporter TctB family protein [Burkholderiales bacterium]|nr:tripartite tricarboxylate transporter TctB family protein [Burkholderiales bacterium]